MALLLGCWVYDTLALVATILAIVYAYFRHQYQYWEKRGIPVPQKPTFPFGNFSGVKTSRSLELVASEIYNAAPNDAIVGCYLLNKPLLVVRDMELIKNILVKDFGFFHDRGLDLDLKKDPLAGHLFLMNGQEWRNLRIKLTPTFTTGKMKMMFPTLMDVGKDLVEVFEKETKNEETEVKDILSRYTTDVIASVAFGIETNSLKNPDAEFRKMGDELSHPDFKQSILNVILFASPKLAKYLPLRLLPKHISDFFLGVVKDTIDYRVENNVQRKDFMQLLVQLKTLGYVKDADDHQKDEIIENQQKFTLEQAAAQAFLFFFAGFETSSATIQFALYELALNPELQKKLQEEVDKVKKANGDQITYEALADMDLLDRVVAETLRKYPVAAILIRACSKDYPIPNTDMKILADETLWFPIYAYHHDPQYYPEPEKFDPDRFLPEVKETRPHYAYLPFGEGPRNCIGNRFGLMQTKAGLALILSRFNFAPSKRTPIPMVFDVKSNILAPKGAMHLNISNRV